MKKGRSAFLDVELFLIANGRLPNETSDKLSHEMVKKVIDLAIMKNDQKAKQVLNYAFHMFHILGPNHKDDCKDCN